MSQPDVIIVGGGHNGLVAAAYLSQAGKEVALLEARDELGGAVASTQVFPGVDASLSRFSYLVSLLPKKIVDDLGLQLELRSRTVASYTPVGDEGVLVERPEGPATAEAFREATGSDAEYQAWQGFEHLLAEFAQAIEPTFTGPLPRKVDLESKINSSIWQAIIERPIGEVLESTFANDTIRGILLTDALIGLFTRAHDETLRQNRCFLYHVVGNGTGEWKVPVGGMGAVAASLVAAAQKAGATLRTSAAVTHLIPEPSGGGRVRLGSGEELSAPTILVNCAPAVLDQLLGEATDGPEGSQVKVNLLLKRLPQLRSGLDPAVGFAGTLHLNQGYARLEEAYQEAASGEIPDPLPCEVYCHSLTDPSILSLELQGAGYQTLTLFGLHTPAGLFQADPDGAREEVKAKALASLQSALAEPLDDCLALDVHGNPCVEVMTPLDIEAAVGMPGGHIFHGDLAWPWLDDDEPADTPAQRWGVATSYDGILLCGSGARRGGAVSGLGGHNAAMAVLETD